MSEATSFICIHAAMMAPDYKVNYPTERLLNIAGKRGSLQPYTASVEILDLLESVGGDEGDIYHLLAALNEQRTWFPDTDRLIDFLYKGAVERGFIDPKVEYKNSIKTNQ